MRILHVIDGLGGSGGAENRLVEEALRFGQGIDQRVVRLYERDFLQGRLERAGIPVVAMGLHGRRGAWNWPLAAWRLYRLATRFHPDVIHTSLFASNLAGQLAGIASRTPVVSTMTLTGDRELHRRFQPGAASWRATLLRRLAAGVARHPLVRYRAITRDAMVTNCRVMRFPSGRVEIIPRGVDERRAGVAPDRARFGLPQSAPVFVNVGRQTAQKGQVLLIEAFSRVLEGVPDALLVIAGEESDASGALRRAIAEHRVGTQVRLAGFRADADVLMASADVFLFSSLAEGLGTVVLEALSAGLPVVAFDIPPVREAVEGAPGVRLVPPGDVERLAADAVVMLRSDEAREAATRGSAWVAERYDLEQVAGRLETYLRSVAESGVGRSA